MDIGAFLDKFGLKWTEGSVRVSKGEMKKSHLKRILITMKKAYPWLSLCMKDIRVADVGVLHDLTGYLKADRRNVHAMRRRLEAALLDGHGSPERKQLVFDLLQAKMEKDWPGSGAEAYRQIRRFLENEGFEHVQQSAYESKEPMSSSDILDLCDRMRGRMPWLRDYLRDCRSGDIFSSHDMTGIFRNDRGRTAIQEKSEPRRIDADRSIQGKTRMKSQGPGKSGHVPRSQGRGGIGGRSL